MSRVRIDGHRDLAEHIRLDKSRKHDIEIVIDRLVVNHGIGRRLTDSMEITLSLSEGLVLVNLPGEKKELFFSEKLACSNCDISHPELPPTSFPSTTPREHAPTATASAPTEL